MSFGIALAGGGTRGAAHVGVLLALDEAGLKPDSIAGTSAGSMIAGLYAAGMTPTNLKELVVNLSKDGHKLIDIDYKNIIKSLEQFFTRRPISLSGFLKGEKLEQYLCSLTGSKTIKDVSMRTVIPTVDLCSGDTIVYTNSLKGINRLEGVAWKDDVLLCEAIRASCSVPTVFKPKQIDNMILVDGGVTDILPVNLLIAAGEKNVLAVDISESYHSIKNNNIIQVASHSFSIMGEKLRECISTGEKYLIKPDLPEQAGLLTFKYMIDCMNVGYEYTVKMMPDIKKALRM